MTVISPAEKKTARKMKRKTGVFIHRLGKMGGRIGAAGKKKKLTESLGKVPARKRGRARGKKKASFPFGSARREAKPYSTNCNIWKRGIGTQYPTKPHRKKSRKGKWGKNGASVLCHRAFRRGGKDRRKRQAPKSQTNDGPT